VICLSIGAFYRYNRFFNGFFPDPVNIKIIEEEYMRRVLFLIVVLCTSILSAEIRRVSISTAGTAGNNESGISSISTGGRFIAFESLADNLVTGDTNACKDIFVHDSLTGETVRVSVASDGTQADAWSGYPSISADGRYVVFQSSASNLVPGDTNGESDIFLHDLQTGQTSRLSVAADGTEGNRYSFYPCISADGRYAAFESYSNNLVAVDYNGYNADVFVKDLQTGQNTIVSVSSTGTQGNSYSGHPTISADGRYVGFQSYATNLVPGDTAGFYDIFVHDRQTGQTTRASVASNGTEGNANSLYCAISTDGRYVSFESPATNLVPGDTNNVKDVFVHDLQTAQTTRVSVAEDGTQGDRDSRMTSISPDGRYVAFNSFSTTLVPGDNNGYSDIFIHDQQTGQLRLVSVAADGTQADGPCYYAFFSADGEYISFQSYAGTLVPGDVNGTSDVFVVEIGDKIWLPVDIDNYIQNLPDTCFSGNAAQRKSKLHDKIVKVQDFIEAGSYQEAIDTLLLDIKPKMDGLDQNDWIICTYAQTDLTAMIDALVAALGG
jgi:Tol biopolymer transport system component